MIRRNFTDLSDGERETLAVAFNHVNGRGLIDQHAETHENYFSTGIHWRPQFLPWHRYFLRRLELAMQEAEPTVMLPYWDWTRADSRDIDSGAWKDIFGGRDNTGGKFDTGWSYLRNSGNSGWDLPDAAHVVAELSAGSFSDYRKVEGANDGRMGSHVHAHVWVGGTMGAGDSPRDPLFYLHHCNIDRLWAIWQANNAAVGQYDGTTPIASDTRAPAAPYVGADEKMPEVTTPWQNQPAFSGATPNQMLDPTDLGYFEPRGGYGYDRDLPLETAWQQARGTVLKTEITIPQVAVGV